ncbi:hypothetical protein [Rhodopseudomonas sp. B29]|uniref:hypothetical protein n=1 Tax=Rhodopseudomonas sp. B29 TaxID=95607 RepID=UPI00034C2F72|nr:hypothetical protein [Rhodopseudomonas sp. B29]
MNDPVTLFPNLLQPTAKSYAPLGVTFWQGEESLLGSMKEYAEGWFERRKAGTEAALQLARRMGEAATPLDVWREYQDWAASASARLLEDVIAYQQQFMKANARFTGKLPGIGTSAAENSAPDQNANRLSA